MYRIYLITRARRHYELVNLAPIIYGDNNNTWCDRQKLRGLNILLARLRQFNYRCRCYSDIEDLTQSQTASGSAILVKGPPFGCIQTISSRALFNFYREHGLTRIEQPRLGWAIIPIMFVPACICRTHKIHFIFVTLICVLCPNDVRTEQLALFLNDVAVAGDVFRNAWQVFALSSILEQNEPNILHNAVSTTHTFATGAFDQFSLV